MTAREKLVAWFKRVTGVPELPPDLPPPPEYDRPDVPRTPPEELRKAREAVRTLDIFIAGQEGRLPREPRDRHEPRR